MSKVNVTIDSKSVSVSSGKVSQPTLAKLSTPTTNTTPRINIPALNQKFSAGDNVTINGNEVITSSLN